MGFELPKLDYDYSALEPHIDAQTMEIHYSKHHNAYLSKLNAAIEGTDLAGSSIENIVRNISNHSTGIRNNGGGYWNHSLFWSIMAPNSGGEPGGNLGPAIEKAFGSFSNLREDFSNAAATRFGSGWAWLIVDNGELKVTSTPNQDNPMMDIAETKGTPILGLDVWEHAYYLKYQNKRPDYINAWWNVVNWSEVENRYNSAK